MITVLEISFYLHRRLSSNQQFKPAKHETKQNNLCTFFKSFCCNFSLHLTLETLNKKLYLSCDCVYLNLHI
jgi:hypothetical protein